MTDPDLRFVGFAGFDTTESYEADRDEIWEYQTETVNHGKDERGRDILTVKMLLLKPKRCIASRNNAHP